MLDFPLEWKHGSQLLNHGATRFRVWAPAASTIELHLPGPPERTVTLEARADGYFEAIVENAPPDTAYSYRIGGSHFPDPASRLQPDGVHAPSRVADPCFDWNDASWPGLPLDSYIFYELHTGTFTPEGTFDAIIPQLPNLKDLGITAIELMPIAQFPGDRNWGYDGVFPFAVQRSYGGPAGLKRLVDACHRSGLAVVLDVVYNHLGPEGNYFSQFAPYFTDAYKTPWGPAINFDEPDSDEVRRFFVENALYWIAECHIDALRLDAIHAIHDESAQPFLQELATAVHAVGERLNRAVYLFPETDRNDARLLRPVELGGIGMDAQWNDGFHHSLRTLLTGDQSGYYADYGELHHLAKAYREGYVYSGQYSTFRRRRFGSSSADIPAHRFVVFGQNHDQVGNRMLGERLGSLVSFEHLKLAAAAVLLSPFLPLLFMGEEYGETAPFLYFVSHSDPQLIDAVRAGRKEEFAAFSWQGEPPDPQDEATFTRSKLRRELANAPVNDALFRYYRELIRLRKSLPSLFLLSKDEQQVETFEAESVIRLHRWNGEEEVAVYLCFSSQPVTVRHNLPGEWTKILDSASPQWMGPGPALPDRLPPGGLALQLLTTSVVAYKKESEV